jgi:hypothetical protein
MPSKHLFLRQMLDPEVIYLDSERRRTHEGEVMQTLVLSASSTATSLNNSLRIWAAQNNLKRSLLDRVILSG